MKRMVACAVLSVMAAACGDVELSSTSSEVTSVRRYVVLFKSDTLPKDFVSTIGKAGGNVVRSHKQVGVLIASGTASFAASLAANDSILSVTPEHYTPISRPATAEGTVTANTLADEMFWAQWDMRRLGAPALYNRNIPAGPKNVVAVIDTGVMYDHPDLAPNMLPGVTTSYCSNDRTGYPSYDQIMNITWFPEEGYGVFDCVANDPANWFTSDPGTFHGTHVAGTIAAARGNGGIIGVSPTTKIVPYRVFDYVEDNFGYKGFALFDEPWWAAIIDAADRGIPVINMSLGGMLDREDPWQDAAYLALKRVVDYAYKKGTLIVAAAGNDSTNNNGNIAFVPSDYPSVMSVSATGTSQLVETENGLEAAPGSDVVTFYSNVGAAVDVSAPGGDCGPNYPYDCNPFHLIWSTSIADPYVENIGTADEPVLVGRVRPGYAFAAGTSMASPHAAGVAAAVRGLHPRWTPGQARAWLKQTATSMGQGRIGFGIGLINADAATR